MANNATCYVISCFFAIDALIIIFLGFYIFKNIKECRRDEHGCEDIIGVIILAIFLILALITPIYYIVTKRRLED